MLTRNRAILIAGVVIAVVVLGVFFVVLARQPSQSIFTLTSSETHQVLAGNQTYPGFYSLGLSNLDQGKTWRVEVTVSGAAVGANFCVLSDGSYQTWANSYYVTSNPGLNFPWAQCLVTSGQTIKDTLVFMIPSSGTWDIVAINNNPNVVTVTYSPAS